MCGLLIFQVQKRNKEKDPQACSMEMAPWNILEFLPIPVCLHQSQVQMHCGGVIILTVGDTIF